VDNEAKATTAIQQIGGHTNVIKFFEHGWLRGESRVYYIDMQLADITLSDYIVCFKTNQVPSQPIHEPEFMHPSDALPFDARLVNSMEICRQIASGLQFLHSHECVHRDVKPSNGCRTFDFRFVLTEQCCTVARIMLGNLLISASAQKPPRRGKGLQRRDEAHRRTVPLSFYEKIRHLRTKSTYGIWDVYCLN
jgi:hypothetical protein